MNVPHRASYSSFAPFNLNTDFGTRVIRVIARPLFSRRSPAQ
jgi:hypothetical protein